MKVTQIFFIALIFHFNSGAQTSYNLDFKNGFKQFKLGTPSGLVKNIVRQTTVLNFKGVSSYRYTGNDISEYSGVRIEQIHLDFFKNKLFRIMVFFTNFHDNEYSIFEFNLVNSALTSTFGASHKCNNTDPSIIDCAIWDGKKVRLDNLRLNISNHPSGLIGGYLLFVDKGLEYEQQNAEID